MTIVRPRRAVAYVRGLVPPKPALWLATALISALMVCSVIPVYVGGLAALVAFVMGVVCGVGSALADVRLPWKALTGALSALAAATGLLVADEPLLAGAAVLAAGLIQAPLNARAASMGIFVPVLVSVFATVEVADSPGVVAAWVLVGFVAIHWLAQLFSLPTTAQPLSASVAWRHAGVFAIAAGLIQYLTMGWALPHGYWLILTLASVLRPVVGETRAVAVERTIGTIAGVVLALLIVWTFPQPLALLLALPCATLMIGWAVMKDLRRQTMFGTPVIVLVGSAGALSVGVDVAMERLLLTALGALIAGVAVVVLNYLERRAG